VRTAPEAIARLSEGRFDVVMLDHDLAEEHYLTLSEGLSENKAEGETEYMCGTGMDVVDFLVTQDADAHGAIIVHSWNPMRGAEMHMRLRDHGVNSHKVQFDPYRCPININLHKEQ
jgi:hypothetical protein